MIEIKSPFGNLLGLRIVEWSVGIARIELPVSEALRNINRTVHGGVIATLIDFAGSMAGALEAGDKLWPENVVSLSMSVNFLRPAGGELLRACGRATGGGKAIFMSSVEVHDAAKVLLATGQGAFKRMRATPSSSR